MSKKKKTLSVEVHITAQLLAHLLKPLIGPHRFGLRRQAWVFNRIRAGDGFLKER